MTIRAEPYSEIMKKMHWAIHNRQCGLLIVRTCLFHYNVHPKTTVGIRAILEQFVWETFEHPPYRPNIAPNDFQ